MELIKVICPSCGGELNISKTTDFIFCNYCGNKFAVPYEKPKSPDISNYLLLAEDALALGNSEEASNYFNKVLEFEPNNYQALIGKGYAVFLTSTLANPKLFEMEAVFKRAFSFAPKDKKGDAALDIKAKTLAACKTLFNMAHSHFNRFKGTGDAFDTSTFDDFHRHCMMIIMTIDKILALSKDHRYLNAELCNFGIQILNTCTTFKFSYRNNKKQEYKNKINTDKQWIKEKAEEEKLLQQKKYWEEHPEEYQAYLDELEKKKIELESRIDEKSRELDEFSKKANKIIYELKNERDNLGFFAIKQKKHVDIKIKSQDKKVTRIKNEVVSLIKELQELEKKEI